MYAYPAIASHRREKVEPNLVIGFVPSMMQLEETAAMYKGWRDAALKIFLRPTTTSTGFPWALKTDVRRLQLGVQNHIIGTTTTPCTLLATGIADYILPAATATRMPPLNNWKTNTPQHWRCQR